jgi:hypothetical protein
MKENDFPVDKSQDRIMDKSAVIKSPFARQTPPPDFAKSFNSGHPP